MNAFEGPLQPAEGSEGVEKIEDWRELKKTAPEQFNEFISSLEGYQEMSRQERIDTLEDEMFKLSIDEDGNVRNETRFLCQEIAHEIALLDEDERHEQALARIGRS